MDDEENGTEELADGRVRVQFVYRPKASDFDPDNPMGLHDIAWEAMTDTVQALDPTVDLIEFTRETL